MHRYVSRIRLVSVKGTSNPGTGAGITPGELLPVSTACLATPRVLVRASPALSGGEVAGGCGGAGQGLAALAPLAGGCGCGGLIAEGGKGVGGAGGAPCRAQGFVQDDGDGGGGEAVGPEVLGTPAQVVPGGPGVGPGPSPGSQRGA